MFVLDTAASYVAIWSGAPPDTEWEGIGSSFNTGVCHCHLSKGPTVSPRGSYISPDFKDGAFVYSTNGTPFSCVAFDEAHEMKIKYGL